MKDFDFVEDIDVISNKTLSIDKDNIGHFVPSDFADKNRTQIIRLNFVKDCEKPDGIYYCNYNGELINARDLVNNMTLGVRLTMTVNLNKISEETVNE